MRTPSTSGASGVISPPERGSSGWASQSFRGAIWKKCLDENDIRSQLEQEVDIPSDKSEIEVCDPADNSDLDPEYVPVKKVIGGDIDTVDSEDFDGDNSDTQKGEKGKGKEKSSEPKRWTPLKKRSAPRKVPHHYRGRVQRQ